MAEPNAVRRWWRRFVIGVRNALAAPPRPPAVEETARERAQRIMRTTMALLRLAVVAGILAIIAFAFAPLNVGNWRYLRTAISIASVGLGVSGAALLAGTLLGFLFGIPRTLQGDVTGTGERYYQVNTNLEQISDWLTKIIVGITLVDLRMLPGRLMELNEYVAPALGGGRRGEAMAGGTIVYFSVAGFLFGYLGTRLYLAGAIPWADADTNISSQIAQAKDAVERAGRATRPATQKAASTPPAAEVQKLAQYADAAQPNPARLSPSEARTLALSYYLMEEYPKSLQYFERALEAGSDPNLQLQYAVALAESGERDRAIQLLEELAARGSGKPDVHQLLGYYLLWYPSRATEAADHSRTYLRAHPNDGAAHLNLASALADQAEHAVADPAAEEQLRQQALTALRNAVRQDPYWRERAEKLRADNEHFTKIPLDEFRDALAG